MTRRTEGTVRVPTRTASAIMSVALHRLPSGPIRTRYQDEFTAELYGLGPARQLRHALGVLLTAGALQHAVGGQSPTILETTMSLVHPAKPWGCRLNVHHHWKLQSTEDGHRYMACTRCNKEHPGTANANPPMTFG